MSEFGKNVVVIKDNVQWINESKSKDHAFIMFFMNGCTPCNMTKPSWTEIADKFNGQHGVLICAVESQKFGEIFKANVPKDGINGFPTFCYYHKGVFKEKFTGGRSVDDFKNWINRKTARRGGKSHKKRTVKKKRSLRRKTRKWLNLW